MMDHINRHHEAYGDRASAVSLDAPSGNRIEEALRDRVKAELQAGEYVNWIGRPRASLVNRDNVTAMIIGLYLAVFCEVLPDPWTDCRLV